MEVTLRAMLIAVHQPYLKSVARLWCGNGDDSIDDGNGGGGGDDDDDDDDDVIISTCVRWRSRYTPCSSPSTNPVSSQWPGFGVIMGMIVLMMMVMVMMMVMMMMM